jgi:hypothetical protein
MTAKMASPKTFCIGAIPCSTREPLIDNGTTTSFPVIAKSNLSAIAQRATKHSTIGDKGRMGSLSLSSRAYARSVGSCHDDQVA